MRRPRTQTHSPSAWRSQAAHRFAVRVACFALASALMVTPALAEWKTNYQTGQQALKDKDYRAAENAAIEALNESEKFGETDDRRINTLELLGDIYRESRQWAAAAGIFDQVLAAYKKLGTDQGQEAGTIQNKLGIVYQQMRDLDKAEAAYLTSLQIKRKKYKQNVASIAIVVSNLGELYRRKKEWAKAEELHKQALGDKENELGPEHPLMVTSLNNLALVYSETKRYAEARQLLDRAVAIAAKGENNGKNADHATALHNLGDLCYSQSLHKEAKAFFEKALAMRREVLGPQHPNVADTLTSYANTLFGADEFEATLPLYDEAIAIRKLEYGASDSRTTKVMGFKAMALDRLKRTVEAQQLRDDVKALEARRNQP